MRPRWIAVALACVALAIASPSVAPAAAAAGAPRVVAIARAASSAPRHLATLRAPARRPPPRRTPGVTSVDQELAILDAQQLAHKRNIDTIQMLRDETARSERNERFVLGLVLAIGIGAVAFDSWRKKHRGGAPGR